MENTSKITRMADALKNFYHLRKDKKREDEDSDDTDLL